MQTDRRQFFGIAGVGLLGAAMPGLTCASPSNLPQPEATQDTKTMQNPGEHVLPELPYGYDALEPHYDEKTLTLHHTKHHAAYVKGLNDAEKQLQQMLQGGDFGQAKAVAKAQAFHGSGHVLHSIFWTNMKPKGGGKPEGELAKHVDKCFGNYEAFKKLFLATNNSVEGSGWGALCYRKADDRLVVLQVEKHENFTIHGAQPLLVCDMWEHAFYLKWQNNKTDWTATFMDHLVNWENVAQRLTAARG